MTVYVDRFPEDGWGRWNGGAHMLGSDLDELHDVAARIGMRRAWFQATTRYAHYDLTAAARARAVASGAVEIPFGRLPGDVLMRREDGTYEPRSVRLERRAAARRAAETGPPT